MLATREPHDRSVGGDIDVPASLEGYGAYVEERARRRDGEKIYNNDMARVEYVVAQLIKSTSQRLRILTECLCDDLFGTDRVVEAMTDLALQHPSCRVCILSEVTIHQSRLLDIICSRFESANVLIRTLRPALKSNIHFMVADDIGFRIEQKDTHQTVSAFGNGNTPKDLAVLFDRMAAASK